MNVLQKKVKYNDTVMRALDIIKFKHSKIKLNGTASLQAMKYFSDYDFTSTIKRDFKTKTICEEYKRILNSKMDDLYFIEFKIQYKNGKKLKLYDVSELRSSMFKKIDFVKIDYVIRHVNIFKELTIMYVFNKVTRTKDDMIAQIQESYHELKNEGNNYKAVKRLYSIYKIKRNYKKLIDFTRFFNETGQMYELLSNLKTIKLLAEYYDDTMTQKKILINLKDLRIKYNDIDTIISEYENELNEMAKQYII